MGEVSLTEIEVKPLCLLSDFKYSARNIASKMVLDLLVFMITFHLIVEPRKSSCPYKIQVTKML